MARYVCEVCGLAYDEDEGMPEFGLSQEQSSANYRTITNALYVEQLKINL